LAAVIDSTSSVALIALPVSRCRDAAGDLQRVDCVDAPDAAAIHNHGDHDLPIERRRASGPEGMWQPAGVPSPSPQPGRPSAWRAPPTSLGIDVAAWDRSMLHPGSPCQWLVRSVRRLRPGGPQRLPGGQQGRGERERRCGADHRQVDLPGPGGHQRVAGGGAVRNQGSDGDGRAEYDAGAGDQDTLHARHPQYLPAGGSGEPQQREIPAPPRGRQYQGVDP
jgi:hypothetical protein